MRNEAERLEALVAEQKEKAKAEASDEKSEKGSEMETDEDVSQESTYIENQTRIQINNLSTFDLIDFVCNIG